MPQDQSPLRGPTMSTIPEDEFTNLLDCTVSDSSSSSISSHSTTPSFSDTHTRSFEPVTSRSDPPAHTSSSTPTIPHQWTRNRFRKLLQSIISTDEPPHNNASSPRAYTPSTTPATPPHASRGAAKRRITRWKRSFKALWGNMRREGV